MIKIRAKKLQNYHLLPHLFIMYHYIFVLMQDTNSNFTTKLSSRQLFCLCTSLYICPKSLKTASPSKCTTQYKLKCSFDGNMLFYLLLQNTPLQPVWSLLSQLLGPIPHSLRETHFSILQRNVCGKLNGYTDLMAQ